MIEFHCTCGAKLKVKDEAAGRKVRCPECQKVSVAPQPGADAIQERRHPPGGANRKRREDAEAVHDERPRSRRIPEDDEDDRPRRRPRDDDDVYEDDERPRRKTQPAASGKGLLIGIVAGGAVLIIAAVVGLILIMNKSTDIGPVVKNKDGADKGKDGADKGKKDGADKGKDGADKGKDGGKDGVVKNVQDPVNRAKALNNFKQIGLAFHNHESAYQTLPAQGASGKLMLKDSPPRLSWRVKLLPFLDEEKLYNSFNLDESWDGPNNIKLLDRMPKLFEIPGRPAPKAGYTYVQLVSGPGTLYPAPSAMPRFTNILDGTSNTILFLEAAEAVPWTKVADFVVDVTIPQAGKIPALGGFDKRGFFGGIADGSVRFVDRTRVDDRVLGLAFNPADGQVLPDSFFD